LLKDIKPFYAGMGGNQTSTTYTCVSYVSRITTHCEYKTCLLQLVPFYDDKTHL